MFLADLLVAAIFPWARPAILTGVERYEICQETRLSLFQSNTVGVCSLWDRKNVATDAGVYSAECIISDYSTLPSVADCSTITLDNLQMPAGQTLNLSGLKSGTKIVFRGTTTFGYSEWSGPLISITGGSITVTGETGSVIDGQGQRWWDGQGGNGGKTKPKFIALNKLVDSYVSDITVLNPPVQVFSINSCSGLTLTNVTIDGRLGNQLGGHNTDGFDIGSSSDILIQGATVWNQDDCLAVNSGSNIAFVNGSCDGGHGLSIGSVGGRSDNTVKNVTITQSKVINSQNAVRIKTNSGTTGSVSNITYRDIEIQNATSFGIVIEQDYLNGGPTGMPTSGVLIAGIKLENIHGTVNSNAVPIKILCASCSDWSWSDVLLTGSSKADICQGVPTGITC